MTKAVIFDMFETLITHYRTPLYFSEEMAADAGVDTERFRSRWRELEADRTLGRITFDDTIRLILEENGAYSDKIHKLIVSKRKLTKQRCLDSMHEGIMPMIGALKSRGVKLGLISNCFSEEAEIIKASELYKVFDAPCLSYDLKIKKPDAAIFDICIKNLGVKAEDCIYIGDGGSCELEAAENIGMRAYQAMWYSYDSANNVIIRDKRFPAFDDPCEVAAAL